jgi:hypothetical protein
MARPPIFETPDDFEAAADAYFDSCKPTSESDGDIPTVNGLCLALGMTRKTLWAYADKPEFCDAVEKARTRLEMAWERRLAGTACTGAIFWLKNQGWTDKTEQKITADVSVSGIERRIVRPAN